MSRITTVRRSFLINLLVLVSAAGLLQACGNDKKAPPPAAIPDPTGYYDNTGTLPALGITDMQAMIYNNRFIMASKTQGYYYDGPVTVSGNTITSAPNAIVQFVSPGVDDFTATLSATINPDRSISGTVTHSNNSISNPFTLNYATGRANSTVAAIANTSANLTWVGTLYNLTAINGTETLEIGLADNAAGAAAMTTITPMAVNPAFRNCVLTGTLAPITGTSLYAVSFTASSSCTGPTSIGGPYTGFATLRTQTNLNDTLVIAAHFNNLGTYRALFGEFR